MTQTAEAFNALPARLRPRVLGLSSMLATPAVAARVEADLEVLAAWEKEGLIAIHPLRRTARWSQRRAYLAAHTLTNQRRPDMAFTCVVRKKPNPIAELAKLLTVIQDDERVEVKGESRSEIEHVRINMLKRLKGKITTQMNGDNVLYIWRK